MPVVPTQYDISTIRANSSSSAKRGRVMLEFHSAGIDAPDLCTPGIGDGCAVVVVVRGKRSDTLVMMLGYRILGRACHILGVRSFAGIEESVEWRSIGLFYLLSCVAQGSGDALPLDAPQLIIIVQRHKPSTVSAVGTPVISVISTWRDI